MKLERQILIFAMLVTLVSCDKKQPAAGSETDAAKLRPEVAAAQKGASPTALPQATVASTPAP